MSDTIIHEHELITDSSDSSNGIPSPLGSGDTMDKIIDNWNIVRCGIVDNWEEERDILLAEWDDIRVNIVNVSWEISKNFCRLLIIHSILQFLSLFMYLRLFK